MKHLGSWRQRDGNLLRDLHWLTAGMGRLVDGHGQQHLHRVGWLPLDMRIVAAAHVG